MTWDATGPLLVTALAVMGSPGPSTVSLVAAVAAFGTRPALRYAVGLVAGTTAVLVGVATGVTGVLLTVPGAGPVLLAVSAAYVLWLAYRIATAPPLTDRRTTAPPPTLGAGALLGAGNPKAWVAIAAVYAGSPRAGDPTTDAVGTIALLTGVIVVVHAAWLAAGIPFAALLRRPRLSRVVHLTLAAALVASVALVVPT
ncbi:LysE family translocator [Modestobacter sp. I12A-02662]|uniref:LysE family translocator n=1 Tax=Modestobacter sp. I12A-02662 TaxID=1730496 RepID=UPI0034E0336C